MFSRPLAETRRTSRVPAGIFADDGKREGIKVEKKRSEFVFPTLVGSRSFQMNLDFVRELFVENIYYI